MTIVVCGTARCVWREDIMPWWVAPGTRSFYIAGAVYATIYAACMSMREAHREDPPEDDDALDEAYEHPFQPVPILLDGCVKVGLTYVVQILIINRSDLDNSQHVSSE